MHSQTSWGLAGRIPSPRYLRPDETKPNPAALPCPAPSAPRQHRGEGRSLTPPPRERDAGRRAYSHVASELRGGSPRNRNLALRGGEAFSRHAGTAPSSAAPAAAPAPPPLPPTPAHRAPAAPPAAGVPPVEPHLLGRRLGEPRVVHGRPGQGRAAARPPPGRAPLRPHGPMAAPPPHLRGRGLPPGRAASAAAQEAAPSLLLTVRGEGEGGGAGLGRRGVAGNGLASPPRRPPGSSPRGKRAARRQAAVRNRLGGEPRAEALLFSHLKVGPRRSPACKSGCGAAVPADGRSEAPRQGLGLRGGRRGARRPSGLGRHSAAWRNRLEGDGAVLAKGQRPLCRCNPNVMKIIIKKQSSASKEGVKLQWCAKNRIELNWE